MLRHDSCLQLNLKEERVLAKAIETLDLEKSYVMKLLDLEKKQVKFGQKRMRDKVKTIRTHLQPTQIITMQTMEEQGKFKPEYTPMKASGLIRILAATKRLKLMTNDQVKELIEKDLKRPLTTETTTVTELSRPVTPAASLRQRSRSLPRDLQITGESESSQIGRKKFPVIKKTEKTELSESMENLRSASRMNQRAPSEESLSSVDLPQRPSSGISTRSTHVRIDLDTVDGVSTTQTRQGRAKSAMSRSTSKQAHVVTTRGFLAARPQTSNVSSSSRLPPRTPRSARPKTSIGVQSLNYSSHKIKTNTEDRCRRESVLSTSSIGSEIAREKAAEFRKELLNDEQNNTAFIEDRRKSFLTRISHWVETNPPIHSPAYTPRRESLLSDQLTQNVIRSNKPELSEWAKMKQCRWLRLGDDQADTSGVVTLVRDQMKQLKGLRI